MTNEPMLSVERELLESCWSALMQKGQVIKALELRALLDKPADDPNLGIEMMRGAGSGLLIQDHGKGWEAVTFRRGVRVGCFPLKGGYKEIVAALDAARHQGEPVAYRWCVKGRGEWTASVCKVEFDARANDERFVAQALYAEPPAKRQGEPVGEVVHVSEYQMRIGLYDEYSLKVGDLVYAEQPAPVAVVLPERLNTYGGYSLEAETWYNLALDEAARLNRVKP